MRSLYFVTNGQIADAVQAINQQVYPAYDLPTSDGILGPLAKPEIDAIAGTIERDGYHIFSHRAPAGLCHALRQLALSVKCTPQSPPAPSTDPVIYDPGRPVSVKYTIPELDLLRASSVQSLLADTSLLALVQSCVGCAPVLNSLTMWWSTAFSKEPDSSAAQLYHVDMDHLQTS